jgi:hypothetical protein
MAFFRASIHSRFRDPHPTPPSSFSCFNPFRAFVILFPHAVLQRLVARPGALAWACERLPLAAEPQTLNNAGFYSPPHSPATCARRMPAWLARTMHASAARAFFACKPSAASAAAILDQRAWPMSPSHRRHLLRDRWPHRRRPAIDFFGIHRVGPAPPPPLTLLPPAPRPHSPPFRSVPPSAPCRPARPTATSPRPRMEKKRAQLVAIDR